jgi:hypothetical protein
MILSITMHHQLLPRRVLFKLNKETAGFERTLRWIIVEFNRFEKS